MPAPVRAALLGASGDRAADLLRLGARHPGIVFEALAEDRRAGKAVASVFPQLGSARLADFVTTEHVDWPSIDVVFSALPHGNSQEIVRSILAVAPRARIIDLAADYRLRDPGSFQKWYGRPHAVPQLLPVAAYGLPEINREAIRGAPIVACPGALPTAALIALVPLLRAGAILTEDLIIDAKAGPGRGEANRWIGESVGPTAVGNNRHVPEIEQELTIAARRAVTVSYTPHAVPLSRGALVTAYAPLGNCENAVELTDVLAGAHAGEAFVRFAAPGEIPATGSVRGSNQALIGIFDDRVTRRAIIVVAIDDLVKGGAGQAIQNFNAIFGWPETTALEALPLYP